MKKYGINNFKYEIIEECSEDELNEKEQYYIKLYDSYIYGNHHNGYNLSPGGESIKGIEFLNQETIQTIIDLWNSGMAVIEIYETGIACRETIVKYLKKYCSDYNTTESIKRSKALANIYNCKSINQYSLEGILIKTYSSIADASKENNISSSNIVLAAQKKNKTANGYFWIYTTDNQKESLKILQSPTIFNHSLQTSKIEQYDLSGNYIKTYDNAEAAAKEVQRDVLAFRYACNNGRKVAGYQWKWAEDTNKIIKPYNRTSWTGKYISQYSLNNQLLNVFKTGAEAARYLNLGENANNNITRCCRGLRSTAYGYKWQYITKEQYDEEKEKQSS